LDFKQKYDIPKNIGRGYEEPEFLIPEYTEGMKFLSKIYKSDPTFVSVYDNRLNKEKAALELLSEKTSGKDQINAKKNLIKVQKTQEFIEEIKSYKPKKEKK